MRTLLAWFGLVLTALTFAPPVQAQRAPVLAAADLREQTSLDGPWHWSIDPYRDGLAGFHGGDPGSGHKRWEVVDVEQAERDNPTALFEYDLQRSPTVSLPGSWIGHAPEMRWYQGLVWYQRNFSAKSQSGKRAFLRFGAADYSARVYLNGKFVGRHEGGFTPFAFEVTNLLAKSGDNQITVGVDSERADQSVPPPVTDWENYGGITRSVSLVWVPETYVDDAWVRLTRDGHIAATVQLDGLNQAGFPVRVAIPELDVTIDGTTDAKGQWTGSVVAPKGLKRWSPEAPTLYSVRVEAGKDVLTDRVGFRTIEVKGQDILLNGKPVFLRGVALHEEELGTNPVRAITPAAARALLGEAKQLHANFVRLAHYPHSEVMTRMADEMGLLVWSEIPVYWRVDWGNAATLASARQMLSEEIHRDRNRASIVLWSVGNETPVGDARNTFLETLVADVRALDDSRLVTAALLSRREDKGGKTTMIVDDPLAASLDVLAVNTYNGWYSDDPLSALPGIAWQSAAAKPMIFSEFGAEALAGYHDAGAKPHKFSEEYQAEYYRRTLEMADKIPFLRGMSAWILKDFRSPRRQHPVYQQGWNRKGLISETGQRKAAFGLLADYYARREGAVPAEAH